MTKDECTKCPYLDECIERFPEPPAPVDRPDGHCIRRDEVDK